MPFFWFKRKSADAVNFTVGQATYLFPRLEQVTDEFVVRTRTLLIRWMELVILGREQEALALMVPETRPGSELQQGGCERWTAQLLRQTIRSYGTNEELEGDEQFHLCQDSRAVLPVFASGITVDYGEYRMNKISYWGEVMADLPKQMGETCEPSDLTARFRFVAVGSEHLALLLDDIHVL